MHDSPTADAVDCVDLAANIVTAYVSKNSVQPADLGGLIAAVHRALIRLSNPIETSANDPAKPTTMQIRKSITHEAIISFEDGKPYKSMKRHLKVRGLTPQAYREKYGLSPDYPVVAAGYSAQRSELARAFGLGTIRTSAVSATKPAEAVSVVPKPRGRPRKNAAA